jgi:phosphoribosyl 1,2-cyclic phosphodiesterase
MNVFVRVNGCGNAWPVFLGTEHPFYNRMDTDDLGSASYSVMGCMGKNYSHRTIEWEVVIDAGHNAVPFLLKNENRIPDALLLTHGHLDHILGADWIAQSLNFTSQRNEKLPLYATNQVWQQVLQTIPHIRNAIAFYELKPGRKQPVKQVPGLFISAFPVYHGDNAHGGAMLLVEYDHGESQSHVLFTGDLLFPFLRNEDYATISKAQAIYIDCSNRFSYPASNHISFTTDMPEKGETNQHLKDWKDHNPIERIVAKQLQEYPDEDFSRYFDRFLQENGNYRNIPFSVMEFLKKTGIPFVQLVHYFGYHDNKYYHQDVMGREAMREWTRQVLMDAGLKNIRSEIPQAGHMVRLD